MEEKERSKTKTKTLMGASLEMIHNQNRCFHEIILLYLSDE